MDYEKKYKKALERAKEELGSGSFDRGTIEYIFPELKESEDERIRKELINFFSKGAECDATTNGIKDRDIIAWLEKQGQTFTKKDVDDAYLKGVCDTKHELEKQGEQKPFDYESANIQQKDFAPNVEPKFKVGDRVNKNDRKDEEHCILTITLVNIDEHCYICDQYSVIDFGEQDLWHIVEQKPAWSEEDEEISKGILNYLCLHDACELEGFDSWYDWLKSIKYRVQSKQEWSEEDERMRQYVVNDLRFVKELVNDPHYVVSVERVEKEIDWMESLKERIGG